MSMWNIFNLFKKKENSKGTENTAIFEELDAQLRKHKKPSVELKLSPAKNIALWNSKVGGKPYLPMDSEFPLTESGNPMFFLAQINFAEMPHLEGFPQKGILQFFIDLEDEIMGLESSPKVIYHSDIKEDNALLQQDFPEIDFEEYISPFEKDTELSIEFNKVEQLITTSDFRFSEIVSIDIPDEIWDKFYDVDEYNESGHRVGGYPYFTQYDIREGSLEDYILLFQLDSDWGEDVGYGIMWGDAGVANFFIHPEDLKNLDFSKVVYTWDCG